MEDLTFVNRVQTFENLNNEVRNKIVVHHIKCSENRKRKL